MPMMMDDPLNGDGFDSAVAAAALGSQALDDEMDMNDLFGDDAAMAMPVQPAAKGLANRIMELKECGACQRVAWSNNGPIVAISADSKQLWSYALVRDPKTGNWELSKPVTVKLPENYSGRLKNVYWTFMGRELAVTDDFGHVLLYDAALGHGHIDPRGRLVHAGNVGEMSCIIGMHSLPPYPQAQKIRSFWNAQLEGDTWVWQQDEHRTGGPSNPIDSSRTAIIAMTRSGRLRLMYQAMDGQWKESAAPVDDLLLDHDNYFTHASFAPDKDDGLFMVTYDTQHDLRLYKIRIAWNLKQTPPQEGQQQAQKVVNPTVEIKATKLVPSCIPSSSDESDHGGLGGFGATETSQYVLTHLEMIPPAFVNGQPDPQRPFPSILTVFKSVGSILPSMASALPPASLGASSQVWIWEMQPAYQSSLSAAFDQLAAKKHSTDTFKPKQFLNVVHAHTAPIHNTILSITPISYNTVLAMAMADGSVEFWKRDSMFPMDSEANFSSVYSLTQSGFKLDPAEPVLSLSLSPNSCCTLSLAADSDQLKLRTMRSTIVGLSNPENAQQRSATAAVLALQLCSSMFQFRSCQDDLLALVPPDSDLDLHYEIIEKTYSALKYNLDFVGENAGKSTDYFFRAPWVQRLFGQQAIIGPARQDGRRSLSAKLAYVALAIRHATLVVMMVFRMDQPVKPDIAISLGNIVQWCLDLMIWIVQEMDRLSEHLIHLSSLDGAQTRHDRAAIESFIAAENSPALLLLLCSGCRTLLRQLGRPLRHGWIHYINSEKAAPTQPTKAMFIQALAKYVNSPICKMVQQTAKDGSSEGGSMGPGILFEVFITDVDKVITDAYKASSLTAADRAKIENDMFIRAKIPEFLMPAIKRILTDTWPNFAARPSTNFGAIYRHDVSWLGFTEDRYTQQWQKRHVVDVIKKTTMPRPGTKEKRIRYCTRCGSGMEDITLGPQWPGWVIGSMKNCICHGNWGEIEG